MAQTWLVLELASKEAEPWWLGVIGFARGLPLLLLSLYGGALADQLDRRRLLLLSQPASLLVALVTGILIAGGWATLPMVAVMALAASAVQSIDAPTRQALVPDLVPKDLVARAVTLNSMSMYLSMSVGPALAGFSIKSLGLAGTFYLVAATYVVVLAAVALLRIPARPLSRPRQGMAREIREGVAYVRHEPVVLWLICCTFMITGLGMAFTNLGPVLIRDLGGDAQDLGLTLTAWGLGAATVSIGLTMFIQKLRGTGALLLGVTVSFTAALLVMAAARSLPVVALTQVVVGASNTAFMIIGNAAILSVTPGPVRGRVMGIYMMNRGLMPVGALAAGALGGLLGVRAGIALLALGSFTAVALITLLQPGAWRRVDAAIAAGAGPPSSSATTARGTPLTEPTAPSSV
jgi:predicted MFS family arabinose efflux permease